MCFLCNTKRATRIRKGHYACSLKFPHISVCLYLATMETTSFLLTIQKVFSFLLRCFNARSKKRWPWLFSSMMFSASSPSSLLTSNPAPAFLSPLCPPPLARIHPHISCTGSNVHLFPVLPAPVREERQPEQLPAQCVQPSQHPHRLPQPPSIHHAQWGCGSRSCCPHPASARPAPSGPRWRHPDPPEEARPL